MSLDLPPYGPIPDDVRDRVRKTVQKRIRRPRYRTPLVVAAAVALLAAGAVVVTTRPSLPAEPAQAGSSDVTMDRCWAAIQKAGKTAMYPERSKWRLAVSGPETYTVQAVVGIASDQAPFFCQTTDTSVTVSAPAAQPHYVPGSKTAAILMLDNLLAGVVDPTWPAALISAKSGSIASFTPREGMFIYDLDVYRNLESDDDITVSKVDRNYQVPSGRRPPGHPIPRPDAPAVTLVDRPAPPQDRTSELGKALGDCLAKSGSQWVFDQDSYGPGAILTADSSRIVMARSPARTGSCVSMWVPGSREFHAFSMGPPAAEVPRDRPIAFDTGTVRLKNGARETYGGLIPMSTARMELLFEHGGPKEPVVANGTFVTLVPDDAVVDGRNRVQGVITAKLFDSNGLMTYSGPVNFWEPSR